jgi:HK97 family phage portal protein
MNLEFRDAIKSVFGILKQKIATFWREIGGYTATFSPFNGQIYANETCRACIRKLAEETSKANAKVGGSDKRLETLLNLRPNMFMNGKDFLYKCRTLYEINNTLFIFINRDELGRCISLYPIPQCPSELQDAGGELYIKFYLPNGKILVASWADLAVLRKDFNTSDVYGDDNTAINTSLDLLNTANQGMANAIKSTANLRGVLQSKKAMLTDDDIKKARDQFVANYMTADNASGIGMTDSMTTFTPVNMRPIIADAGSLKELNERIYHYYGLCEKAVKNEQTGDEAEATYEGAVEPFLIALSLELSYKIYTDRQRGYGNEVKYESKRMQFMTMASKLALVQMVDRESMQINEWREVLNLAPLPDGDRTVSWQNPQKTTQIGTEGGSATAGGELSTSETEEVVGKAEDVAGKTLNGAQTQSLITVVSQYAAGTLTIGQAINIIAISIGISKEDAKKLLEGAVD